MSYQYTDSGLDNVFLENGYTIHHTPYGEGISIEDTDGLHQAIGKWLVSLPKPLTGAECRFLRLEMGLTQRDLAGSLGVEEQAVRRWEKNRDGHFSGPADRLLRVLYVSFCDNDAEIRALVERLNQLDQVERAQARFADSESGWRLAA